MAITKAELRQIVREEIERSIRIVLEARNTATAIEKGLLYSDGSRVLDGLVPLHNKSALRR